jgi:hypothetical protein
MSMKDLTSIAQVLNIKKYRLVVKQESCAVYAIRKECRGVPCGTRHK